VLQICRQATALNPLAAHDTTPTTFIVVLAKETVNDGSGCGT
jgi:hypothetical protein